MNWMQNSQRRALRGAAVLSLLFFGGVSAGCSGDDDGETQCETTEDCGEGEFCQDGICVEGEAPENQENQEDIVELEDEDYLVSFWGRRAANLDGRDAIFKAAGSRDGSVEDLLSDEFDCVNARECGATEDFSHFLAVQPGTDGFDVIAAPIDASAMTVGEGEVWLQGVFNPRLRGNGVIYDIIDDGRYMGYYGVPGGDAREVAPLGLVDSAIGRYWDADPVADRAIVYLPTLETVEIWIGTISGGVSSADSIITFDRENFPGTAGSFFIGQLPAGFSEEGRFVAVSTVGPNAYGSCVTNDDCTGTSHVCGSEDRCVAIEATVDIIDMESANTLGDPCTSHERCGEVHRCDSPTDDFDQGVCMPQRVALGVPNQPSQGGQGGCAASRADGSYTYTNVRGPMSFGPDGRLYFVGMRDCVQGSPSGDETEANIPKTAILAVDLSTGTYEEVYGNIAGEDFSDARCYDEIEFATDITDCVTVIQSARLSPDGNDLVFMATNPTVVTPALANRVFDIWRVRRDGEDHDWLGNTPQSYLMDSFRVHPYQQ